MRFLLLGTGGWISPPYLDFISILVEVGNKLILIDPSEYCVRRIQRLGIELSKIDLVLVTHSHGDHALGFPTLVIWLSHLNTGKKIRVLALDSVINDLRLLLRATRIEKHESRVVDYLPIDISSVRRPSIVYRDDVCEIRAVLTRHTVECLAFRITELDTGKSLTYTGDTAPCDEIVELAQRSDILICEASCLSEEARDYGHSSTKDAVELARRASVRLLVPVHYYVTGDIIFEKSDVPILVPTVNHWYMV